MSNMSILVIRLMLLILLGAIGYVMFSCYQAIIYKDFQKQECLKIMQDPRDCQ